VKLLIDVNVFVDVLRHRVGWESSLAVLEKLTDPSLSGFISSLSIPILYFLHKPGMGDRKARKQVAWITRHCKVVPLTGQILDMAYRSLLPDFEDAIQFYSAREVRADYIITRNKKIFVKKKSLC
jgi:predicted nucleic acid-binding protein